MGRSVIRL